MCFPLFSKDEVTGSGVDEGRGERFVPETEKDVNENVKRETKETSGKRILLRNKFVKKMIVGKTNEFRYELLGNNIG